MYKKNKKNTDLRTINSLFKSLSKSIKKVDHQIIKNKNVPQVKKKMLWKQKKKSYQQKSIIFDNNEENPEEIQFKDEELNVPKERLFKSQLKVI